MKPGPKSSNLRQSRYYSTVIWDGARSPKPIRRICTSSRLVLQPPAFRPSLQASCSVPLVLEARCRNDTTAWSTGCVLCTLHNHCITLLRSIRPRNSVDVPDGTFNPLIFPRASVAHGGVLTTLRAPFAFVRRSSQAPQPRSRSDTTAPRRSSSATRRRPPTTRFIHRLLIISQTNLSVPKTATGSTTFPTIICSVYWHCGRAPVLLRCSYDSDH